MLASSVQVLSGYQIGKTVLEWISAHIHSPVTPIFVGIIRVKVNHALFLYVMFHSRQRCWMLDSCDYGINLCQLIKNTFMNTFVFSLNILIYNMSFKLNFATRKYYLQ